MATGLQVAWDRLQPRITWARGDRPMHKVDKNAKTGDAGILSQPASVEASARRVEVSSRNPRHVGLTPRRSPKSFRRERTGSRPTFRLPAACRRRRGRFGGSDSPPASPSLPRENPRSRSAATIASSSTCPARRSTLTPQIAAGGGAGGHLHGGRMVVDGTVAKRRAPRR